MLTYLAIADRLRPRWIVWENVPGVLSSNGGRDFGSFLGAMGELWYVVAYRVLDAQWCRTHGHPRAVPQRRRRVFVVGCLGDWERAAQVLFERESVQRDSAPRRTTRQGAASDAQGGVGAGLHETVGALCADTHPDAYSGQDAYTGRLIPEPVGYRWQNDRDGLVQDGTAPACRASSGSSGFHEMNHPVVVQGDTRATTAVVNMQGSKSNACVATDGTSFTLNAMHGHDVHAVAHAFYSTGGTHGVNQQPEVSPAVKVGSGLGIPSPPAVAFQACGDRDNPSISVSDTAFCLPANAMSDRGQAMAQAMTVRRLTPRECERLQGFPDDYTLIPWRKKAAADCPDGPRYKALGNSMAVNCMAWIGERIAAVENHDAN